MGTPLGPRAIVQVGKGKNGKAVYSYMLENTAKYFGFTIEKKIPQSRSKKGRIVVKRGSTSGASAIKVPTNRQGRKGATKYKQIPMPPGMTIPKIQEFLKRATKNKPESFVTADGKSYPVSG